MLGQMTTDHALDRSRTTLDLSAAFAPNSRTQPILDGTVTAQGLRLFGTAVHPSEMFWRQLKFAEFDVSEMSCSSLLCAAAKGPVDWVAIPVFTTRQFFHTRPILRAGAGIATPADLAGKRVGVPEYQQTAAVWTRGILSDEFGVDPRTIEWFMERNPEQSHGGSTGFTPPPGVRLSYISRDSSIGEMLADGTLDATIIYLTDKNLVDRSRSDLAKNADIRTLFPDPLAEGHRYFAKTGIFPINHTVVIRKALLEQHPWIALNLYKAFVTVKEQLAAARTADLQPWTATGLLGSDAASALRQDPLAYGIRAARPVLETVARYLYEQGLTQQLVRIEDVFATSTLDL
jgi:4,5-dihydroxyphthalate decarboxylase